MTPLDASHEAQRDASIGVALRMVDGQNAALFLDVDGTLLDLAERPDAVLVPEGLVGTLARAVRKLHGALALVSGRTIDEIDRLFAPPKFASNRASRYELRPPRASCLPTSGPRSPLRS